jgi:hypothetical protein
MKTYGGIEAILQLSALLSSVLDKDSQLHALAALPTDEEPAIHRVGDWMDPGVCLGTVKRR